MSVMNQDKNKIVKDLKVKNSNKYLYEHDFVTTENLQKFIENTLQEK